MKIRKTGIGPVERSVKLPVPIECDGPEPKCEKCKRIEAECRCNRFQSMGLLACHEALFCQRCDKCLHHCECGPAQLPIQPKRRPRGPDPNQMELCPKPELRY